MDNDLKKLSRVELLELLISLSEDFQVLADENVRLRKALSTQRVSRSAKVGSLAEAALQANGYFDAAQRSADGYLREIKRLRDELAKRVEAQGRSEASARMAAQQAEQQALLDMRQAHARADQIIARANAQAQAILTDARNRANEMRMQASTTSYPSYQTVSADAEAGAAPARRSVQSVPSPANAPSASIHDAATVELASPVRGYAQRTDERRPQ